jgi:hypothetical protein
MSISEKQLAANRRDALSSTGPRNDVWSLIRRYLTLPVVGSSALTAHENEPISLLLDRLSLPSAADTDTILRNQKILCNALYRTRTERHHLQSRRFPCPAEA